MLAPNRRSGTAFVGSESPEDQDVRRLAPGRLAHWAAAVAPDQVPAVRRAERPGQLELGEPK
jgi:hypothetical protein